MQRPVRWTVALLVVLAWAVPARAYIEVPYTLGKVIDESTHIVLMEVTRVQKDKGLVLFKKVKDLKGTYNGDQFRHNIGTGDRGFHPRESRNILNWAAAGERAVFFCNNEASETCIGSYWYQCYREDQWWGMSHAEPYLLRTFCGDADDLARAVNEIVAGKEAVIPCLVDANRQQLHERKGKLQRLKASLRRLDYNPKRDFVGFGADGVDVVEVRTDVLLAEGASEWRFVPASGVANAKERWYRPEFDDRSWRTGKAPIGYGEDEIAARSGTQVAEKGQAFVFRRAFTVPEGALGRKETTFQLNVAADNGARVYFNGDLVLDESNEDHEFAYWNATVEVPVKLVKAGRNVIAVLVSNTADSSDLYLDAQLVADTPIAPAKPARPQVAATAGGSITSAGGSSGGASSGLAGDDGPMVEIAVDKSARTIVIPARIAARKLPNLSEVYPLEVVATAPPPKGRKAHETVVTTDARPSQVHAALESLGLKPGQPAKGEVGKASGPEVTLSLRIPDVAGKTKTVAIETTMVDTKTGKPLPAVKWLFTGSIRRQPDPERDETVYAADLTGTLISIFPVTNETVFQSSLTIADEPNLKLETDKALLPPEGTPVSLVIQAK